MANNKKDTKTKEPSITSIASMIAPPSVGPHVYRVQLRAASGKYLTCDLKDGLLSAKSDAPGADCIFELHRCGPSGSFAVRSPFGRFLNVDENIEWALKDKSAKDPGLRCDRDGGDEKNLSALGPGETCFEIVESPGAAGQIGIRVPQDFFISVGEGATPAEAAKTRLAKNAVAAAATAAAASKAAEIEAARAGAIAAAVAAVTPPPVVGVSAAGSGAVAAASRAGGGKGAAEKADEAAAALAAAIAAATASASAAFVASLPAAPATVPLDFALSPAELLTPTWLDDRSPLSLQGCFAVRTAHARYWCADQASSTFIANRTCVSLWERWSVEPQGLSAVAFRNAHGSYLNLSLPASPPPAAAAAVANAATGAAVAAAKAAQSQILLAPQQTLSFVAAPTVDPSAVVAAASAAAPAASAPGLSVAVADAPAALPPALLPALPASAQFTVVALDKPRGLWAFRAANGRFLSAAGNLSMAASSREVGRWETFELKPCDKEIG